LLIVTHRIGEGVLIGDDSRVVVLEVRGKQVRLGIEAPLEIVVLRDEIFQRLTQENQLAPRFELRDLQEFRIIQISSLWRPERFRVHLL